jgi:hypothetical protein
MSDARELTVTISPDPDALTWTAVVRRDAPPGEDPMGMMVKVDQDMVRNIKLLCGLMTRGRVRFRVTPEPL